MTQLPSAMSNVLRLIAAPYPSSMPGRSRFLLVGDATRPITGLEIDPSLTAAPLTAPFRLKILHFNDLHGRISHLAPAGNIPVFSRLVSHYHQQQAQYADDPQAGVLLLSAGDDMVGTPFDLLIGDRHHPYDLYQTVGVELATLGNHDLDLGTAALAQIIQRAGQFPVLSANLRPAAPLQSVIYPAAIVEMKGVRLGIIGLTTSAQMKGSDARDLTFVDPVQVVHHLLPVLRPHCHALIILSHLGYDLHASSAAVEGYGDRQLADHLPYGAVDLIIGGHTHHILNETGLSHENIVNGIPIVQAGALGRFLGEVTLTLDPAQTSVTHAKLIATADLPVAETFERQHITPIVEALHQRLHQPLGTVTEHPDLRPDVVINDFARQESAFANFITAGMLAQTQQQGFKVDFALTDAAILLAGLPNKTLLYGDWFAVMPHADTLRLWQITGQQLWDFLQDNARRGDRRGEPHLERGFVQFSEQIRYTLHLGTDCTTAHATDIEVKGKPLSQQLTQSFTFVTHSFIRQLARPWEKSFQQQHPNCPLFHGDRLPSQSTNLPLRETLIAHIKTHGGVTTAGGVRRDGRLQIIAD